jgi:hypothetical protein
MKIIAVAISTLLLAVVLFSTIAVFPESMSGLTRFYIQLLALIVCLVALLWVVMLGFLAARRHRTKIALWCSVTAASSVVILCLNEAVVNMQLITLAILKGPKGPTETRGLVAFYSVSNLAHYIILYRYEGTDHITQETMNTSSDMPASFAGCEKRPSKLYSDFYRLDIFC